MENSLRKPGVDMCELLLTSQIVKLRNWNMLKFAGFICGIDWMNPVFLYEFNVCLLVNYYPYTANTILNLRLKCNSD